ncbi:MAG: GNAT family N-acetyltransferase [Pseudomonadota bacterium]
MSDERLMEFEFLHHAPEHATSIAEWYFQEWGKGAGGSSRETVLEALSDYCLDTPSIPLAVLALEGKELWGVCQLKHHELQDAFPALTPWLGGVYVRSDRRGRRIASTLVSHTVAVASGLGLAQLYLQTSRLDGGFYRKLGWVPITSHESSAGEVLIMQRGTDA